MINLKLKANAITITPIAYEPGKNGSYENYETEKQREAQGYNPCWTDAPENNSRVGNLFAFIRGGGTKKEKETMVEVRSIVSIPGPQSDLKRTSWYFGQPDKATEGQRNLLVLSPVITYLSWEEFCALVKWAPYHSNGTIRTPVQRTQNIKIK